MSQAIDRILQEVRTLPLEEQDHLRERLLARPQLDPEHEAAARNLFGKYAHVPTSSAEFCARKAADLAAEEHA